MCDVIVELGHLRTLASQDPTKRFHRLYRLLRQGGLLAMAKARIAGNQGAQTPGVDGQTLNDITDNHLIQLSDELAAGTYQPQPVRRVYIPKKNGKLRPLGIPASRDKIVQAGVTLILEALYEPLFRPCSHGFRPGHSTITALRQVSTAYRAGAKWIIEGDITDCFGSLPHSVILNCLRKRIRDERFIDLIRKLLQAGVMEAGQFAPTYSGTPQGGIASPILANVALHELDVWLEQQLGVNPPPLTAREQQARSNPEYMRLHYRITDLRRYLDGKRPMPKGTTPDQLRQELREKLALRRLQPRSLPRKAIYYTRYADDFVITLCHASKQDAEALKTRVTDWMRTNLGLTLNQDKTQITHWREKVPFLGYELEGRTNANGTGWLYLAVPRDALRRVTQKIQHATAYPQAPEYDVFQNVNAIARGWSNYYRYAHNTNVVGGKLSSIIYWRTVHYLGKRQRRSIAKLMRDHYARDPRTGCLGLYIYKPGHSQTEEHRYFLWHKTLPRLPLNASPTYHVQDREAYLTTGWAKGRSEHKKWETRTRAKNRCESCGATLPHLYVHHPNRLARAKRVKKGWGHVAQSGMEQHTKLLCHTCHMQHHQYASL
jgi:group II intron reverse transcriptase/maturase